MPKRVVFIALLLLVLLCNVLLYLSGCDWVQSLTSPLNHIQSNGCGYSSKDWCKNRDIAKKCQVWQQCVLFVWTKTTLNKGVIHGDISHASVGVTVQSDMVSSDSSSLSLPKVMNGSEPRYSHGGMRTTNRTEIVQTLYPTDFTNGKQKDQTETMHTSNTVVKYINDTKITTPVVDKRQAPPPVDLEVYYETLCPDSLRLLRNQLWPTMHQLGSAINLTLVPYGKVTEAFTETSSPGGDWAFNCQHGPHECEGNAIHACALKLYGKMSYPLLECMLQSRSAPQKTISECAKRTGTDSRAIKDCAQSRTGELLLHLMGEVTRSLGHPVTYVPWVKVNGNESDSVQDRAARNMHQLICDCHTEPKPHQCAR